MIRLPPFRPASLHAGTAAVMHQQCTSNAYTSACKLLERCLSRTALSAGHILTMVRCSQGLRCEGEVAEKSCKTARIHHSKLVSRLLRVQSPFALRSHVCDSARQQHAGLLDSPAFLTPALPQICSQVYEGSAQAPIKTTPCLATSESYIDIHPK